MNVKLPNKPPRLMLHKRLKQCKHVKEKKKKKKITERISFASHLIKYVVTLQLYVENLY